MRAWVGAPAVTAALLVAILLGGFLNLSRTSAFTPRAPILIDGDGNFTAPNGVSGGSGTPVDPFVIEGWEINASAGHGILIRNTSAHFVIQDAYVHSGGPAFDGIRLENATNGVIRNGTFAGNRYGVAISALGIAASRNVTVLRNNLTGNVGGLAVTYSAADVAILNNTIATSSREGILLWYAANVTVGGNTVTESQWGIHVGYSDAVTVSWNRVLRNPGPGILVSQSTRSTLYYNRVTEDEIEVRGSQFVDLVLNGVVGGDGISVIASQSISIVENTLASNIRDGVMLFNAIDVGVYHNQFVFDGAYDDGTQNRWDNGYPSGGNYWLAYAGADQCSGPAQDVCPESDGIGDFPHPFDSDSVDRYPLMSSRREYVPPGTPTLLQAVLAGAGDANLRLTWLPSADDSAPGGTVGYRVLRATEARGPYSLLTTLPAVGSPTYTYTCPGCGHNPADTTSYFYKIRAADAANNTADSGLAAKYSRSVVPGGNLLAVPLLQTNWSLPAVFRTIAYDTVRTYRSSDPTDPWKAHYASRPGDLGPIGFGDAFWVNVLGAGTYTVAGLVVPDPSFALRTGWNLVAYAAAVGRTRDESLAGLSVAWVEAFDPGIPGPYRLRSVAGADPLVPGDGYWVFVRQSATWVQD